MWNNLVQRGRPQTIMWRMRIARWITKATDTHSEYVTLTALPLQQWLHERSSIVPYITSIVIFMSMWVTYCYKITSLLSRSTSQACTLYSQLWHRHMSVTDRMLGRSCTLRWIRLAWWNKGNFSFHPHHSTTTVFNNAMPIWRTCTEWHIIIMSTRTCTIIVFRNSSKQPRALRHHLYISEQHTKICNTQAVSNFKIARIPTTALCVLTPCDLTDRHRRFGETRCLLPHG